MEGDNEKKQSIGDYLRELRERKNIDLKTVAYKTKINYTILKELEGNNYSRIPDKTYIRGFVKSYLKEVGGDLNEALELLENTYTDNSTDTYSPPEGQDSNLDEADANAGTHEESAAKAKGIKVLDFFQDHKNPHFRPIILVLLGTAVLVLSIYIIKFSSRGHERTGGRKANPRQTLNEATANVQDLITTPMYSQIHNEQNEKDDQRPAATAAAAVTPKATAAPVVTAAATPTVKITSTPTSTSTPSPTATMTATPAATATPKATTTPTPTIVPTPRVLNKIIEFKKIDAPLYTVVTDAKENKDPNLIPDYIKNSATKGMENIYVNAVSGDSWVTYKADGQEIKSFVLRKGKRLLVRGKEVKLFVGNVNAVKVFYNNQLVSAQSDTGVKSFIFPENSAYKYSLPLFVHDEGGKIYTEEEYRRLMSSATSRSTNPL